MMAKITNQCSLDTIEEEFYNHVQSNKKIMPTMQSIDIKS